MLPLNLYARVRVFCAQMHTRPRVQRAPGLPCSLFFGRKIMQTSDAMRRENAKSHSAVIPAKAGIQYSRDIGDGIERPQRTGSPPSRG